MYLRQPMLSDRTEFLARNAASRRLYRGLAPPLTDPRLFAAYVRRVHSGLVVGLLVCRCEDDAIVGSVNLSQIVRGAVPERVHGLSGVRAVRQPALHVGRAAAGADGRVQALKLHRVEANIQPGNLPSIALVKRAGFSREGYSPRYLKIAGRWRDHERWAMTAETYRDVSRSR